MHKAAHGSEQPMALQAPLQALSPMSNKVGSPASQYERIESNIGEGTYGKVHRARDIKTGRHVAIKKTKMSAADREVGGIGFTALREIKVMQAVRHPNVMGCLDVFMDGGALHIVMELMDADLRKVLDDRSIVLSEAHVKCMALQLLEGLGALHQKWFAHRDVTPTNLLVSYASGVIRLTDFGFARSIGHKDRPLTPMCTTLWYRAPELLYGAKFYGQAVDIWSAGCIIAEFIHGEAMFRGRGEFDMLAKIFEKRGTPTEETWRDVSALPSFVEFSYFPKVDLAKILPRASRAAGSLIDSLLSLDPKQRPSALEALAHNFFTSALPAASSPIDLPFVQVIGDSQ